jgi:hypothetical protein
MFHIFLSNHREVFLDRCLIKVLQRAPTSDLFDLTTKCVPPFLNELIVTFEREQDRKTIDCRELNLESHSLASSIVYRSTINRGLYLSNKKFMTQIIDDYSDLCEAILDVAQELSVTIRLEQFVLMNQCLDKAIDDAVSGLATQIKS